MTMSEYSSDDEASSFQMRGCLPVSQKPPPSIDGNDYIPANGSDYLYLVQMEAKNLLCSKNFTPSTTSNKNHPLIHPLLDLFKEKETIDISSDISNPHIAKIIQKFKETKRVFFKNVKQPLISNTISKSGLLLNTDSMEQLKSWIIPKTGYVRFPTVSEIGTLTHLDLVMLIQRFSAWLSEHDKESGNLIPVEPICMWIYAIFVVMDELLTPEEIFQIRTLGKSLSQFTRNHLSPWIIISIIREIFGQRDISYSPEIK